MLRKIKNLGLKSFDLGTRLFFHTMEIRRLRKIMRMNHIPNKKAEGEDVWLKRWNGMGINVSPRGYRLFSRYMPCEKWIDIIPEDVCESIMLPILNPRDYQGYYGDKNNYGRFIPREMMPQTLLRRIGGLFYDDKYQRISPDNNLIQHFDFPSLILKPSKGTSSGQGVRLFTRNKNSEYLDTEGVKLTPDSLHQFGDDYILQECVKQSKSFGQFNKTSVNTIRLTLYRSVKDDTPHVLSGILRIGKTGSYIDNSHAGGGISRCQSMV